jgi:hypothetical protein
MPHGQSASRRQVPTQRELLESLRGSVEQLSFGFELERAERDRESKQSRALQLLLVLTAAYVFGATTTFLAHVAGRDPGLTEVYLTVATWLGIALTVMLVLAVALGALETFRFLNATAALLLSAAAYMLSWTGAGWKTEYAGAAGLGMLAMAGGIVASFRSEGDPPAQEKQPKWQRHTFRWAGLFWIAWPIVGPVAGMAFLSVQLPVALATGSSWQGGRPGGVLLMAVATALGYALGYRSKFLRDQLGLEPLPLPRQPAAALGSNHT